MTNDLTVEERLSAAFGEPMSARARASLETRVTNAVERVRAPRRRFGLRLTRTLLVVALLMIVLPSIFVVGAGIFDTEAPYGMGTAEAYDAELAAAKAVTPIPPGATWPPYLERAEDRSASYGTGLGRSMVEMNAYCLWLGYWYQAQASGDAASVGAAVSALDLARSWESFTDPLTSDHGFRDNIKSRIDAAERGDAETVLFELETNCTGTWPPSSAN
jgi:hypothetical protein